jgi:hypothetical protein
MVFVTVVSSPSKDVHDRHVTNVCVNDRCCGARQATIGRSVPHYFRIVKSIVILGWRLQRAHITACILTCYVVSMSSVILSLPQSGGG